MGQSWSKFLIFQYNMSIVFMLNFHSYAHAIPSQYDHNYSLTFSSVTMYVICHHVLIVLLKHALH